MPQPQHQDQCFSHNSVDRAVVNLNQTVTHMSSIQPRFNCCYLLVEHSSDSRNQGCGRWRRLVHSTSLQLHQFRAKIAFVFTYLTRLHRCHCHSAASNRWRHLQFSSTAHLHRTFRRDDAPNGVWRTSTLACDIYITGVHDMETVASFTALRHRICWASALAIQHFSPQQFFVHVSFCEKFRQGAQGLPTR